MGSFLVILSALGFATLGIFGKLAIQSGFARNEALFLRFLIAAPLMGGVILILRSKLHRRKNLAKALVLGAVGIGVEATLFFMTLEHLGASLAGIFLYLYPAFVAILSHLFLNEKLTLKKWGCVFLALLGSVLTAGVIGGAGAGMVAPLSDGIGLVAGILSGAWYAVYILAGSRLTRDEDPIWVSSGVVLGSLLTFLILCLTTAGSNPVVGRSVGQNGWIAVVGLAVLSTVLPFSTLYAGMKRVGAVKASLLSTLELVFTIILAYLFLGEKLTIEQGAGGILILISVLLSVKAE